MASLLPQRHGGYVPYFLLAEGIAALVHFTICYTSPPRRALVSFRGPGASEPQGLTARLYAMQSMYAGVIRLYAAYNITEAMPYNLGLLSVAGAFLLHFNELVVFKTAKPQDAIAPFVLVGLGSVWMILQRGFYVS
ncbi:hypothetical protein FSARC_8633 [Fusarium sarcochroum]|uniref:Ergosterol biosynthetic protein 28 n=1 Tax=Fusarium sarcochroum TaxID=1208366 RepID=A0A8H4X709_9HYPO|nr:hypothetical protein FSARC_8633 [Fusarium sarcochroum]